MENHAHYGVYKPVCRNLQIGDKSYSVLDLERAEQRAKQYLQDAKALIESEPEFSLEHEQQVNRLLSVATDFGSADAPFILANRILLQKDEMEYATEDAVVLIKIAAERGNHEAQHRMACCYAGKNDYPEILTAGEQYFASIAQDERKILADYYFQQLKEKTN